VSDDRETARLRWRCRRGMLELDVALQRFLAHGFADLDQAGRSAFGRLLATPDPELLGYLQGTQEPADRELQALVEKIR
jgi:antitoxin CptB